MLWRRRPLQGGTRVCNIRINKADELAAPALRVLQAHAPDLARDIAIVNAGLHYGSLTQAVNCWLTSCCMLLHGNWPMRELTLPALAGINGAEGYVADLEFFTDYVKENRDALPTLIWKDTPPQHFEYDMGYYWCAQPPWNPLRTLLLPWNPFHLPIQCSRRCGSFTQCAGSSDMHALDQCPLQLLPPTASK